MTSRSLCILCLWLALVQLCKGLLHDHHRPLQDKRPPAIKFHRQTQTDTSTYDTIDGRSCYRSIEGMNQSMKDLAAKYPDLITIEIIGESYIKKNGEKDIKGDVIPPGYDIYAVNITAPSTTNSTAKGKLLITSGIHAREYTPTELVGRFIDMLIDGYNNKDAQIISILQHTEIHAIIHVNPDGRYIAEHNRNALWRKNMNPTGGCKNDQQYGVDINRNFDFLWGDKSGASDNPCSDSYHGDGPNSEVETQTLVKYAMRVFPEEQRRSDPEKQLDEPLGEDITGMYIDIHSTGNFIYYPWGHRDKPSPDDDAFQAIARKMSYYNRYDLWASGYDFMYPVSGDSSDYMYAVLGVASLGLELGYDFYEDCDTFENEILPMNLDVLLYAASIAGRPFSMAKAPDILDVAVDYEKVDGDIVVTAEVSDRLMVNSLIGKQNHLTGDQDIAKVMLYLDVHPDDLALADGVLNWEMSPVDGEFDSGEEIVEIALSIEDLSAERHTLHIQAIDSDGYLSPVKSVVIEVEKGSTDPVMNMTLTRSPSPNPTAWPTPSVSKILTTTSPSFNPSQSPLISSTPSNDPTLPSSIKMSQSPTFTIKVPTAYPRITSSPTLLPTPKTPSLSAYEATNDIPANEDSFNDSSSESGLTDDSQTSSSTLKNSSFIISVLMTCGFTSWILS